MMRERDELVGEDVEKLNLQEAAGCHTQQGGSSTCLVQLPDDLAVLLWYTSQSKDNTCCVKAVKLVHEGLHQHHSPEP
jgi:hypothetical protein